MRRLLRTTDESQGLGARFLTNFGGWIGHGVVLAGPQIGSCGVGLGGPTVGGRDSAGFGVKAVEVV